MFLCNKTFFAGGWESENYFGPYCGAFFKGNWPMFMDANKQRLDLSFFSWTKGEIMCKDYMGLELFADRLLCIVPKMCYTALKLNQTSSHESRVAAQPLQFHFKHAWRPGGVPSARDTTFLEFHHQQGISSTRAVAKRNQLCLILINELLSDKDYNHQWLQAHIWPLMCRPVHVNEMIGSFVNHGWAFGPFPWTPSK